MVQSGSGVDCDLRDALQSHLLKSLERGHRLTTLAEEHERETASLRCVIEDSLGAPGPAKVVNQDPLPSSAQEAWGPRWHEQDWSQPSCVVVIDSAPGLSKGGLDKEKAIASALEPASVDLAPDSKPCSSYIEKSKMVVMPEWTRAIEPPSLNPPSSKDINPENSYSLANSSRSKIMMGGDKKCCLVVRPTSRMRIFWDLLSLAVLIYDIFSLPLMAFDTDHLIMHNLLKIATTCFWTIDMPMSFLAAYNVKGVLETRMSRIARTYLRSWFVPDLLVIVADWASFIFSFEGGPVDAARIGKLMRIGRILRVLRLMRIVKFMMILNNFQEVFSSDNIIAALDLAKLLAGVIMIVHCIACGWYYTGWTCIDVCERTWLRDGPQDLVTGPPTFSALYLVCFHWALGQFTPAPNNFHPTNQRERAYAVCCLFVGFLTFASILASITATITGLRHKNADRVRKADMIRRFLDENSVSLELGDRVTAFLRTQKERKVHVLESQIPAFHALPDSLLKQLHFQTYGRILQRHPLFFHIQEERIQSMADICHRAASMQGFRKGAEVFNYGHPAHSMFFVRGGTLEYFVGEAEDESLFVGQDSWICEAALWLKWTHRGRLFVVEYADCIVLDAERFRAIAYTGLVAKALRVYAGLFAERSISVTDEVEAGFDTMQEIVQRCWETVGTAEPDTPHVGVGFLHR